MTGRSNRTLIIILTLCLFVSVSLNMFVAGAVITGRWLERRISSSIENVMQAFPPEIRRDVVKRLVADRRELMAKVKDLREARLRIATAMRADPYDAQRVAAALSDARDKTTVLQAFLQMVVADSVAGMPASIREKIMSPGDGSDILGEDKPSPP